MTIYVSDNSSSSTHSREIAQICDRYNVMLRVSNNVSIAQHYHEIFSELNFNYLTILHDDDLVLPGFVQSVLSEVYSCTDDFSVLGFNGLLFKSVPSHVNSCLSTYSTSSTTFNANVDIQIDSPLQLLLRWISPFNVGIIPFLG